MRTRCLVCVGLKSVFVRAYIRVRYGRVEHVSQYCRARPGQRIFEAR